MAFIHQELARGKWHQLTLAQQIGNIGSELARAQSWEKRNMPEQKHQSLERALELIDLTLDSVTTLPHKKEVARLREAAASLFLEPQHRLASFENLETFYLPFAVLARG